MIQSRQQAFSKVWINELKVLNLGEHLVGLGRRSWRSKQRDASHRLAALM